MSTQSDIPEGIGWFVGEDKGLVFTIVNQTTGLAENLVGWTLRWELALEQFGTELIVKTTGAGITLTSPAEGICTVLVASGDTINLTPGTYYYALRKTNLGQFSEVAYGAVELLDTWTDYP